jgi:hypothetical protein
MLNLRRASRFRRVLSDHCLSARGPQLQLFAGYSYLRGKGAAVPSRADENQNVNGWNVSIARKFNQWFALVVDSSGHYGAHHFRVLDPDRTVSLRHSQEHTSVSEWPACLVL